MLVLLNDHVIPRLRRTDSQDMETFKTEVHVPSGSKIEFELHYQEMMHRKLGFYEHTLHLHPGRLVPQFQVGEGPLVCLCVSLCVCVCVCV